MTCSAQRTIIVESGESGMNTPNKLTLLRVILIPVFMILYMAGSSLALYFAIGVFVIAALTDRLDGQLARKYNQVTTFGKLMDPLADKMLIMSALICFVEKDIKFINAGVVTVILARELIVTGIRLIAMGENTVIAASVWGKAKTVSQFVLVLAVLAIEVIVLHVPSATAVMETVICVLTIIATALTVFSGADYIWKNRGLINFK